MSRSVYLRMYKYGAFCIFLYFQELTFIGIRNYKGIDSSIYQNAVQWSLVFNGSMYTDVEIVM